MGSNEEYAQLVETCHQKGLKVIMDMVVNHCGTNYYFIKDLPTEDWVHQFPEFTRSSYRGVTQIDPYRAESDFNIMLKGWFDTTMADLNQENPLVATYLIQNTIWWIEYSGIDGIRMDTYSYPYKAFLANWAKAVFDEYPQFNIVGEVWEYLATTQAHWLKGYGDNPDGYESHLPSVTDFVLAQALGEAFKEEEGWDRGVSRLYYTLTQDRIYPNANGLVTFLDNHDVARYFTVVGEDPRKLKMGIATLLTTRGIPQIYYGTELLMTGNGHDEVREEFPGGWADHPKSAFTKEGRTDTQNEMFDYMQALLQWRKNTPVVYQGKLMHYVPENGVYVYFRYDANHCVMVVLNNSPDKTQTISTQRYQQRMQGYTKATDILNGIMINDLSQLTIPAKSALVLELKK
jgi:glycosidase